MLPGIGSAIAGISAHKRFLDITSQNIAHVNSDGYKSLAVTMPGGKGSGVRAEVTRLETQGPMVLQSTSTGDSLVEMSNVDLSRELVSLILGKRSLEANVKSIQTQDEMLGTLMDILG